jgi:hypothetical protein
MVAARSNRARPRQRDLSVSGRRNQAVRGARLTNSVVDAVWARVPLVPVIVSESAYGVVLVVVFMVRLGEPEPLIEAGLNPPLVMPLGKPDSLSTLRPTAPVKPLRGVTVTVNVVDSPEPTRDPVFTVLDEPSSRTCSIP